MLFVCVENSNRSQMAQAFASMYGGDGIKAFSAGSKPSGKINPLAIESMKEMNYDLSSHSSKSIKDVESYAPFDVVVTMGCGDAFPWMPAKKFVDWQIPDPRDLDVTEFMKIRDLIADNVRNLIKELQKD